MKSRILRIDLWKEGKAMKHERLILGALFCSISAIAQTLQSRQVSGADSAVSRLLDSERYDIVAKPGGLIPESQLKLMLQTLLADRFKLTLHRGSRNMQAYAGQTVDPD
jgi:uncharacterized protein (TIGR03435 family)